MEVLSLSSWSPDTGMKILLCRPWNWGPGIIWSRPQNFLPCFPMSSIRWFANGNSRNHCGRASNGIVCCLTVWTTLCSFITRHQRVCLANLSRSMILRVKDMVTQEKRSWSYLLWISVHPKECTILLHEWRSCLPKNISPSKQSK